jgi:16S rRNA (guanine966-N2)-methyltransferase
MSKKRITPEPDSFEVRPLGARALKSAMDTLRPYLSQATVLDLYAGQGRFGITAAEEGITSITFVEKNRKTATELKNYLSSPRFPKGVNSRLVTGDVVSFLTEETLKYDLIFADPPFPLWNEVFEKQIFQLVSPLMHSNSIFLVKHPSRMLLSPTTDGWTLYKTTVFGESKLLYFSYETK